MDKIVNKFSYIKQNQYHIILNNRILKQLNLQDMHLYRHNQLNHKIKDTIKCMIIHLNNMEVHIIYNYHYLVHNILCIYYYMIDNCLKRDMILNSNYQHILTYHLIHSNIELKDMFQNRSFFLNINTLDMLQHKFNQLN